MLMMMIVQPFPECRRNVRSRLCACHVKVETTATDAHKAYIESYTTLYTRKRCGIIIIIQDSRARANVADQRGSQAICVRRCFWSVGRKVLLRRVRCHATHTCAAFERVAAAYFMHTFSVRMKRRTLYCMRAYVSGSHTACAGEQKGFWLVGVKTARVLIQNVHMHEHVII